MNELPKQAADLVAEARASHSASAQDLERGLSRLHAQLPFSDVGADFGGDMATQTQPWSSSQGFFASKLVKVTLSALALSGGLGLTYLAYPSPAPSATSAVRPSGHELALAAPIAEQTAGAAPADALERPAPAQVTVEAEAVRSLAGAEAERREPIKSSGRVSSRPTRAQRGTSQLAARSDGATLARGAARSDPASADTQLGAAGTSANEPSTASSYETSAEPSEETERARASERSAAKTSDESALAELDLIDDALKRLRTRDATAALTLLEEHARRYPTGKLSVERRGLHVVALCAAGRVSAGRAEQAAFLSRDGSAPIAERVRRACREQER